MANPLINGFEASEVVIQNVDNPEMCAATDFSPRVNACKATCEVLKGADGIFCQKEF